jgi:hypothetical protein
LTKESISLKRFLNGGQQKFREKYPIIQQFFLSSYFRESGNLYWSNEYLISQFRKSFFLPINKTLFYTLSDEQKIENRNFCFCLFQRVLCPLSFFHFFKHQKTLFLVKNHRTFEKEKIETLNIIKKPWFSHTDQDSLFFSPQKTSNHIWLFIQKTSRIKAWPSQWYNFEIPEPIGFLASGWIPPEKQVYQKPLNRSFGKFVFLTKIENTQVKLTTVCSNLLFFHKSRSKLDLLISKKINTIRFSNILCV